MPLQLATEEKILETFGIAAGKYGTVSTTQTGLIAKVEAASGFTLAIYPRLRTEGTPAFTSLANGRAIKVVTSAGTDFIFLSTEPFTFTEQGIDFFGTAGAVQNRPDGTVLWLGEPGAISAGGKTLKKDRIVKDSVR